MTTSSPSPASDDAASGGLTPPGRAAGTTESERPSVPGELKVLIAAAFVIALGFGIVAPVLPQYARSFGVGITAASVIISAFAVARLVFAPGGGALISRFGERPIYVAGLLIVALSTAATGFAQTYGQLLLFRGLGGIGSTMFTVSAMGLIVRLSPRAIRGRVSGYYSTAFLMGGILGPALGGALAPFGYRVPFFIYAVALLVAAAVVARFLGGASLRPANGTAPLAVMQVREAVRDSAYRAALVSGFANGWVNFGVRNSLLPIFAAASPALGIGSAGIALTLMAAGNAAALQTAGRLVDDRGRKRVLIVGLLICSVGTLPLGYVDTRLPFFALAVVAGIGSGLLNPAQQASVADVVGSDRNGGKVLAGFQMSQDVGTITGPLLTGLIADTVGFGPAFAVTGSITLLAVLAWIPARETIPGGRRPWRLPPREGED